MRFAGFTPQQEHRLLSMMGYQGPSDPKEMEKAVMANPAWAARLGKMAEAAQQRIDMRLGKTKNQFAKGGKVQTASKVVENTGKTGSQTPTTPAGSQETLDAAQQAYADALSKANQYPENDTYQQKLGEAQKNLTVAQQGFQLTQIPSADELLQSNITNPQDMVTQSEVQTLTPEPGTMIDPATGQQVSTPTAQATGVPDPTTVEAQTTEAETATASPTKEANTYEATTIGDKSQDMLNDLEAAKADPSEAATVQGQLEGLMADFEDGTPPWASGAMRQATALMQRRGLGASSMAGEAIVLAAMQAALPIAQADARTFAEFELQNLNNEQQMTIFKAQQRMASLFNDQAAENAANQFNATSKNQTDQFFASLETQVSQFNAAQVNGIRQFNAEQGNIIARFNAEQQTTVDMFRAREQNAIDMFNQQLKQQRDQFNAENDLVIAQANAKWLQEVSTINTAEQNISNREAAKNANLLTQRAIDHLHQYERDIMAFAWKSAESAEDRNLRLLLADKDLKVAREQMDAETQASTAYSLFKILF